MIALICFVLAVVASPFKSNIRLEAENAVLRHQLIVLRRKLKGRARLRNNDRWFFVQLRSWAGRRLTWDAFHQIKERTPLLKPKLRLPYGKLQVLAVL